MLLLGLQLVGAHDHLHGGEDPGGTLTRPQLFPLAADEVTGAESWKKREAPEILPKNYMKPRSKRKASSESSANWPQSGHVGFDDLFGVPLLLYWVPLLLYWGPS